MKRPFGVTASAVFVLVGSLLVAALFALIAVTTTMSSAAVTPPDAKLGLWMAVGLYGFLSAWGLSTAIGLFRLRNWARISITVFSVCLCFTGLVTAPTMLLIPTPPGTRESFHAVMKIMAGVCGALGLLGGFWLYYFNRRATRELFKGTTTYVESGRPLSVSIIGWWLLAAGLLAPISAFMKMPAVILGWILTGWAGVALNVAYGAFGVWLGYGLLRLKPLARVVAMSWFVFAAVNSLLFYLLPGRDARFATLMSGFTFGSQPPTHIQFSAVFMLPATLIMVLAPIWFLNAAKKYFEPIDAPVGEPGN